MRRGIPTDRNRNTTGPKQDQGKTRLVIRRSPAQTLHVYVEGGRLGGSAGIWARQHMDDLPRRGRAVRAARDVLYTAALSSIDATGWLPYTMAHLADECRLSVRMTQEAVRLLTGLEYLVQGEGGFRLARYVAECLRDTSGATTGATLGGKKFRHIKGRDSRDSLDSRDTVSPESDFKLSQSLAREERASETPKKRRPEYTAETLAKVWAPIQQQLRQSIEPQKFGQYWEPLELVELTATEFVVYAPQLWVDPDLEVFVAERIGAVAASVNMLRGRTVRITHDPCVGEKVRAP